MCVGWLLVGLALSICESFIIARKRNRKRSWATLVDCVTLPRARFEVWAGGMWLCARRKPDSRGWRHLHNTQQSPPDCHSLLHNSNSPMCLCAARSQVECEMKQDEQKKNFELKNKSSRLFSFRLRCSTIDVLGQLCRKVRIRMAIKSRYFLMAWSALPKSLLKVYCHPNDRIINYVEPVAEKHSFALLNCKPMSAWGIVGNRPKSLCEKLRKTESYKD